MLALKKDIDAGMCYSELLHSHFSIMARNYNFVRHYMAMTQPKRNHKAVVLVFYGDTGSGKSSQININYPNLYKKSRIINTALTGGMVILHRRIK